MSAKPIPKSWRDVLPVHPAADLFPLMSPDELKVLGEDIKKNGLRTPIVLTTVTSGYRDDGRDHLLDGRNRLDAMERVGFVLVKKGKLDHHLGWEDDVTLLPPRPCSVPENEAYMAAVSLNIHRRHLTSEQKRDLIAKLIKATPNKSSRQIAKMVGASTTTATKVREGLVEKGDVSKMDTSIVDTKGRKQAAKKKRQTEDGFARQIAANAAKKSAMQPEQRTVSDDSNSGVPEAPAAPGKLTSALPTGSVSKASPADHATVAETKTQPSNPITAAWDTASDAQRQEFLQAHHLQRKRGRPPTGSKKSPQPKRKGGWPKGKPRKPRAAAA